MPDVINIHRRLSLGSALATGEPGASISGPNSAGLGVNDATVGTTTWTNPDRVYTQNGSVADTGGASGAITKYLLATNFGFTFAGTEAIQGVQVECFGWGDGVIGTAFGDYSIKLVKTGVISGTDLASGFFSINTGGVVVYKSWGGGLNMWGLSLTATDVNDATFGVALSFKNYDPIQSRVVLVDHIRMSVYYT